MATFNVNYDDLCNLVGKQLDLEELENLILKVKGEVDSYDAETKTIEVEISSDRVDMLSTEGLARAIKGLLEIEKGPINPIIEDSDITVFVEESVDEIRPIIRVALVENINMTDELIAQLMQWQEKIHGTHCRRRKKASIGIHDISKLKFDLYYRGVEPSKIKFQPLGNEKEMDGHEILAENEKGKGYGHIIKDFPRYPLLVDKENKVLALPPIINGTTTMVTKETTKVIIDVTGTDERIVEYGLNLLIANLAERGVTVKRVKVSYWDGREYMTPDFSVKQQIPITKQYVEKITGLKLSNKDIINMLSKARIGAKISGSKIIADIPPYRPDFLHPADVIEEIIVSYGYENIEPILPQVETIGKIHIIERKSRNIRKILIGHNMQEVNNYSFSNEEILLGKMERDVPVVKISNPVSINYTALRDILLPEILEFLSLNTASIYPQKVFEVGDVILVDNKAETKTKTKRNVCALITDYKVSFEDIQSILYSLLKILNVKDFKLEPITDITFIDGRVASINHKGKMIGKIGEINPKILTNYGIPTPVATFELYNFVDVM